MIRYPAKSNLGTKGHISDYSSRLWLIIVGKSRQECIELVTITNHKQKEMDVHMLLDCLYSAQAFHSPIVQHKESCHPQWAGHWHIN